MRGFWDRLGVTLGYQRLQSGGYRVQPVSWYSTRAGTAVLGSTLSQRPTRS